MLLLARRGLVLALLAVSLLSVLIDIELRARAAQAAVLFADPESILADTELAHTALKEGKPTFKRYCAPCHGDLGSGGVRWGVPDLTDGDRLYGEGSVAQIEAIVRFGIRANNKRGWNLAKMPAYASAEPYDAEALPTQSPAQIDELTQLLLSFTARATDTAAATRGHATYENAGCWDCHGHQGEGDSGIGAPRLTDSIWQYGGSYAEIYRSIARGRAGYSPAFDRVLTAVQLRSVAVYVAALAVPERKLRNQP